MAAITLYATSSLVSVHQEMSETDPGAEAYASPVTGWVVSTGSTNHSALFAQTERAASTFVDTAPPDGSIDSTNGDCLRSTNPYNGTFDAGDWTFHFCCRANTNGGAQDGHIRWRLFRSANADGSGATEITSAQQQGSLVSNLATSVTQDSTSAVNPGSVSLTNEYLFVQLGWERTGAGGMTNSDVNLRVGNASANGTRLVTPNFTQAGVTGSGSSALSPFASSGSGTEEWTGSGSSALSPFASSGSGAVEWTGSGSSAFAAFGSSGSGTVTTPQPVGSGASAFSAFASVGSGVVTTPPIGSGASAFSTFQSSGVGTVTGPAASGDYHNPGVMDNPGTYVSTPVVMLPGLYTKRPRP